MKVDKGRFRDHGKKVESMNALVLHEDKVKDETSIEATKRMKSYKDQTVMVSELDGTNLSMLNPTNAKVNRPSPKITSVLQQTKQGFSDYTAIYSR